MKRGHCTGLKRERPAAPPQFDAIQAAHLARIEAELAAPQAAQALERSYQTLCLDARLMAHADSTTDHAVRTWQLRDLATRLHALRATETQQDDATETP